MYREMNRILHNDMIGVMGKCMILRISSMKKVVTQESHHVKFSQNVQCLQ